MSALGAAHATSGITANVLTLLLPRSFLARDQLNPYLRGAQGKERNNRQSGADHNVRLHKGTVHRGYADASSRRHAARGHDLPLCRPGFRWMASLRHLGFSGRVRPVPKSGNSTNRRGSTFSLAGEELNKLPDPESIARKLALAHSEQRDQLAQWSPSGSSLAHRMHRDTRTTLQQYYEKKLLSDSAKAQCRETSCLIISTPRRAASTTIWLDASETFRRAGKRKD